MVINWELTVTMLIRIGIAAVLGGLIGLEREKANQPAGLRTHILICLGAVLVMCTGEYIYSAYARESNIDPARLGAQVVSGIGVLCAGTILKGTTVVKGLTTAAGLWVSACIGLAVGSGNIVPAIGTTGITLVVLRVFRYLENRKGKERSPIHVKIVLEDGKQMEQLTAWIEEQHCPMEMLRFQRGCEGQTILYCDFRPTSQKHRLSMLSQLVQVQGIREVEILAGEAAA